MPETVATRSSTGISTIQLAFDATSCGLVSTSVSSYHNLSAALDTNSTVDVFGRLITNGASADTPFTLAIIC